MQSRTLLRRWLHERPGLYRGCAALSYRKAQGLSCHRARCRPRRPCDQSAGRAQRHSRSRLRRRDLWLRGHHRFSGRRHCPHLLAGSRYAHERARHHDRPPVRLVPASHSFCGPGRDEWHAGSGAGRWRADDDRDSHLLSHARRSAPGIYHAVCREQGLAGPLRQRARQPVLCRPAHCRSLGCESCRYGSVCQGKPRPRFECDCRGPLRP